MYINRLGLSINILQCTRLYYCYSPCSSSLTFPEWLAELINQIDRSSHIQWTAALSSDDSYTGRLCPHLPFLFMLSLKCHRSCVPCFSSLILLLLLPDLLFLSFFSGLLHLKFSEPEGDDHQPFIFITGDDW